MTNPFENIDVRLSRIESHLLELKSNSTKEKENRPAFLSVEQAAAYLNIAVQTLYGYTSQKRIPYIKREKKLYFDRNELEEWLKKGKHKSIDDLLIDYERGGMRK